MLVEDSARLRTTLAKALSRLGRAVDVAEDGVEADGLVRFHSYDVIVLDIMLPGKGGLTLLEEWRRRKVDTPIILLTALDEVSDRVRGLSLGADDYLTKPFAIEELDARIEALMRRRHGKAESRTKIGNLEIDFTAKVVWVDGSQAQLTAREFSLLECLARRPGRVLSREQIEAHIYSERESPLSNAVDAAVYSLRQKITPKGEASLLRTRRGLGYVLEEA